MRTLPIVLALALLLPASARADADFAAWARARLVPLDPEPGEFRALDGVLAGVRVIGVGESVHETEPFQHFRFRLLQDLVRRQRVTALVLESGLPEAMAVDDYVRGRTSAVDLGAALPGYFGGLAETRRAMDWIREWNLGPGRRAPVRVYGADVPGRQGSMVPGLDRLAELVADDAVARTLIDSIRPVAAQVSARWWKPAADKYDALPAEAKAALASNASLLTDRVTHRSAGDRERLEWARRVALVLLESERSLRLGVFAPTVPRDRALSENVLWALGRVAPGERVVYWAHNAHIQRVAIEGPAVPPGRYIASGRRLDVVLGEQYLAIATAYGGPARDDSSVALAGSVDATLEDLGIASFLLPLRGGPPQPPAVTAWLSEARPMRFQAGYLTLALHPAFDAVVYFDRASRAERADVPAGGAKPAR